MIEEFKKNAKKYNLKDKRIYYKFIHSFDTMKIMVHLAKKLGLNKSDIKLAKQLGLLHDIGRFEQIKEYNSLDDRRTINHGLIGSQILFDENYINKFDIDKANYDIIKTAIINHSKDEIEQGLTERENLFCKLIRDADKIAIFKIADKFITNTNQEVTNKLKEEFYNHLKVDFKLVLSEADGVVRTLSYVFDINFNYSFEYISKRKLLIKLERKINNQKLKEYFNEANKYIKERIDQNVKS